MTARVTLTGHFSTLRARLARARAAYRCTGVKAVANDLRSAVRRAAVCLTSPVHRALL